MNPRRAALRVLEQVEATPRRLEVLLDGELACHPQAEARDKALATHLVYAVLRHRLRLDHLVQAFVRRPLAKLDPGALMVLRLGAAELTLLRTPDHAAVHAAVELAKARGLFGAAGLINAALRALARGWTQVPLPSIEADPARHLSLVYSHPRWLVEELLARWPAAEVEAWLAANQEQPPLALRANTLRVSREDLARRLGERAAGAQAHPLAPESLVLAGASGPPAGLPGFAEGLWQMQDPGATAIGHLLGVAPGLRVLDMCAGVGGKTGHLAALMENRGEIVAVDPAAVRLEALKGNMARLGVGIVRPLQADGGELGPELGPFARILVDAPCTGLGTVGRRPDVRWRRRPADPARLAELQLKLLARAAELLAPGGALLYATCTFTRAENEAVVESLLARRPDLRLEWDHAAAGPVAAGLGPDGYFRTLPPRDKCDAFFAARLVKGRVPPAGQGGSGGVVL